MTHDNNEPLRPCPFCGSDPLATYGDGWHGVRCETPGCPCSRHAVGRKVWNTRAAEQSAVVFGDKWTGRAKKVMRLAVDEARMRGHNFIGTEHILLGLLAEGEGIGAQALHALDVRLADVRERVQCLIGGAAPSPAPPVVCSVCRAPIPQQFTANGVPIRWTTNTGEPICDPCMAADPEIVAKYPDVTPSPAPPATMSHNEAFGRQKETTVPPLTKREGELLKGGDCPAVETSILGPNRRAVAGAARTAPLSVEQAEDALLACFENPDYDAMTFTRTLRSIMAAPLPVLSLTDEERAALEWLLNRLPSQVQPNVQIIGALLARTPTDTPALARTKEQSS